MIKCLRCFFLLLISNYFLCGQTLKPIMHSDTIKANEAIQVQYSFSIPSGNMLSDSFVITQNASFRILEQTTLKQWAISNGIAVDAITFTLILTPTVTGMTFLPEGFFLDKQNVKHKTEQRQLLVLSSRLSENDSIAAYRKAIPPDIFDILPKK